LPIPEEWQPASALVDLRQTVCPPSTIDWSQVSESLPARD